MTNDDSLNISDSTVNTYLI